MPKSSIVKTYLARTIAVAACSLALMGALWIRFDHSHFSIRSTELRKDLLEDRKLEIENRVIEALAYINFLKARTVGRTQLMLRDKVTEAVAILEAVHAASPDKAQALRNVRAALRAMNFFDGVGYFFAHDQNGVLMAHGRTPELEGQNRWDLRDSKGKYVVRDFRRITEEYGEGFSPYRWTKPGYPGLEYHKLTYVKRLEPLGWSVGAGLYVDDAMRQTQRDVLEWLASRDYEGNEYLFAWKYDGTALVGPYLGHNYLLSTNPEERNPFIKALATARAGGGFVTYDRPATQSHPPHNKLSYVMGVDDWDWFVGSGFETSEVDKLVARIDDDFDNHITDVTLTIAGIIFCFIAAAYIGLRIAVSGVKRDFAIFTAFFTQAADKAEPIDVDKLTYEEFEASAEVANRMLAERTRNRDALQQSEARYRTIFENMSDGYFCADLSGKIQLFNPAALRITRISDKKQAAGLSIGDLYPDEQERQEFRDRILRDGIYDGYVCTITPPDGNPTDVEVNARLVRNVQTGEPVAIEGMFRDVTERKRTQEILVQTEKMQSVAGMAAGMAHEINNPLGGILQGVQNVERRLSPDLPANAKAAAQTGFDLDAMNAYLVKRRIPDTLEGIRDMGARAAEIVAKLLEFSHRSESRVVWVRMEQMVDKAVDLAYSDYDLKKHYGFRSIEIVRDFDSSLPVVSCTETEIQQIILTLLTNAAQAMALAETPPEHPRIVLRTRREDDCAALDVVDNGPGMDEATRRQVFEPFFSTRDPGFGVGLGLSNAYFIATAHHGGSIRVESEPGQGATFTVLLPLGEPAAPRQRPPHPSGTRLGT